MYTSDKFTKGRILKPGLKLIGGKIRVRDLLYQHFPYHTSYVEPFLGSGGVMMGKYKAFEETAGDLNEYLINYYITIRDFPLTFYDRMMDQYGLLLKDPVSNFAHFKEIITTTKDEILKAVLFYLITKHCYNGIWRTNSKGECNSSWGGTVEGRGIFTEKWLKEVSKRVQGVQFIQDDYRNVIKKAPKNATTFVFLDPPYRQKNKDNPEGCVTTYNGLRFTDQDHIDMSIILNKAKYRWMMTINDDELIRELYEKQIIIEHTIFYSCANTPKGRKKTPELIIKNYEV